MEESLYYCIDKDILSDDDNDFPGEIIVDFRISANRLFIDDNSASVSLDIWIDNGERLVNVSLSGADYDNIEYFHRLANELFPDNIFIGRIDIDMARRIYRELHEFNECIYDATVNYISRRSSTKSARN